MVFSHEANWKAQEKATIVKYRRKMLNPVSSNIFAILFPRTAITFATTLLRVNVGKTLESIPKRGLYDNINIARLLQTTQPRKFVEEKENRFVDHTSWKTRRKTDRSTVRIRRETWLHSVEIGVFLISGLAWSVNDETIRINGRRGTTVWLMPFSYWQRRWKKLFRMFSHNVFEALFHRYRQIRESFHSTGIT